MGLVMEKVVIKYEKYDELDLLDIWIKDDYEYNHFLKETGLTDEQVRECIKNEECISILNEIIKFAEGCDLRYCTQCSHFVDSSYYINCVEQCIECAIGNGV